jgi:hypothetical protein
MDLSGDQTAHNALFIPDTIYTPEDVHDDLLPSQFYTLAELADLALFLQLIGMPNAMDYAPWELEDLGYRYVAPVVYADGRMDGGVHAPDYYAYSPWKIDRWEEGAQAIEDYDWSGEEERRRIVRWEEGSQAIDDLDWFREKGGGSQLGDATGAVDSFELGGTEQEPEFEFGMGKLVHTCDESADFTRNLVGGTSTMSIASRPLIPFASRVQAYDFMDDFGTMDLQDDSFFGARQNNTGPFQQETEALFPRIPEVEAAWDNDATMAYADAKVEGAANLIPEDHVAPDQTPTEPLQSLFTAFENSEKASALHHLPHAIDGLPLMQQKPTFLEPLPAQQQSSFVVPLPPQQQLIAAPPFPTHYPARPATTHEGSQEDLDHHEWEAQLQEATTHQVSSGVSDVPALGFLDKIEPEIDALGAGSWNDAAVQVREAESTMSSSTDFGQASDGDNNDGGNIALVDANATEAERVIEEDGEEVDLPPMVKQLGMEDEDAYADKYIPTVEVLLVPTVVESKTAHESSTLLLAMSKPNRRTAAKKSYKETSDDVNDEEEATQQLAQLVGHQDPKSIATVDVPQTTAHPSTKKPCFKAADIIFEEETRPNEDGSIAALHRSSSPIAHTLDIDSDAASPATLRNAKTIVSDRDLAAPDSSLAPGMHLSLRVAPARSRHAGKKRSAPLSKDEAAEKKRVKSDAFDEGDLFPASMYEKQGDSITMAAPRLATQKAMTGNRAETPKRHARGDARNVESDSASVGEVKDTPKKRAAKTTRMSVIVATPPAAGSPAKNKFGFASKLRKTRASKGNTAPKATSKAAAKRGKKADATPTGEVSTRQTRRASAIELEVQAKDENIGKRLRSKDRKVGVRVGFKD